MRKADAVILLLAGCLLAVVNSCRGGMKRLPSSSAQPFEVVLVGDSDSIIYKVLQADVPSLPQPEPLFDVRSIPPQADHGVWLTARTRIVVHVGKQYAFSVTSSKNRRANPQLELTITAPSPATLRAKLDSAALVRLLDSWETDHLAQVIQPNAVKQRDVRAAFGIEMKIPASMKAGKRTWHFCWFSNNAASGMQNLLVFPLPGDTLTAENLSRVLEQNIPGEEDGMYMQITTLDTTASDGIRRGLWEMKGDAMGGPYVLKVVPGSKPRQAATVVLGFVYAPEMRKRNLTKQLEAVLRTVEPYSDQPTNNINNKHNGK